MPTPAPALRYNTTIPMLDEEFDIEETDAAPTHEHVAPVMLCDDLGWEDQLDNGEEMSL